MLVRGYLNRREEKYLLSYFFIYKKEKGEKYG